MKDFIEELYHCFAFPHVVDVVCPVCNGFAQFEFAEAVRIKLKKDVAYFTESEDFEYQQFTDGCGHKWHAAVWYKGLTRNSLDSLSDLPEGYEPKDWEHSKYSRRSCETWNYGSVVCRECHHRQKHRLDWSKDAWFKIEHRGSTLWAFDRETMVELLQFIESSGREVKNYKWADMFLRIPHKFLTAKSREPVAKKIRKKLQDNLKR